MELEKAKNEVQRKIGRNLLLFQQAEHMLKFLVAHQRYEGYISEVKARREQRVATIYKQTMGQLIEPFLANTHAADEEVAKEPEALKEAYVSFAFRLESDAAYYETQKAALASIVADRNELVHSLLPRLDLDSIEGCRDAEQYLDQRREKLLPVLGSLKSMIDALQEGREELAEFLKSDEGKRQFKLLWLRQSRPVVLLVDFAAQAARPDGWAVLDAARRRLRQRAPDDLASLQERYGHKNLRELMLATGLFDFTEERIHKGGIRILYRLKSDWVRQNA